ncbi:MAG: ABC transporter permease [Acholeplasmatales bacterium]|nr:MAG: ABC transporter permease [Acholeplasmatales bacterium]
MNKLWTGVLDAVAKKPNSINILSSFMAAFAGVLLGLVIMIIVSPQDAFSSFSQMIFGPFANMRRIGMVVRSTVPIMLTGLSVAFAFRTGLFNIGASGQMMIGGVLAIYVGIHWTFLGNFQWVVGVMAGMMVVRCGGRFPACSRRFEMSMRSSPQSCSTMWPFMCRAC